MKYLKANRLLSYYKLKPPFIKKGLPGTLYAADFVQMLWKPWGDYEGYYYQPYIFAIHNNYLEVFYLPEAFTALRNHYFKTITKDSTFFNKHYSDWKKSSKVLAKRMQVFDTSIQTDTFDQMVAKYISFIDVYLFEYSLSVPVQEACGFQPEQWITPVVADYCKKYSLNFQKTSSLLSSPIVLSFLAEEEIDLIKIALLLSKTAQKKQLLSHQKKWYWINNNYLKMVPLSVQHFEERLSSIMKKNRRDLRLHLKKLESQPTVLLREKSKLFKKYPPNLILKLYIQIVERFAEMQDKRKALLLRANHYHKFFLEKVAEQFSLPTSDLWFYGYKELVQLITNQIPISSQEIIQRQKILVAVECKDEKIILSGDEAQYFYDTLQEKVSSTKSFTGVVANTGIVTGIAKVVLKNHDIINVTEGDIMVSSMTRPEMTSAMKKAAGFITDEGGITSHAAIISREMKKPCIIGTKIATKLIKDGDLVEIDADKGVVRILNSK